MSLVVSQCGGARAGSLDDDVGEMVARTKQVGAPRWSGWVLQGGAVGCPGDERFVAPGWSGWVLQEGEVAWIDSMVLVRESGVGA